LEATRLLAKDVMRNREHLGENDTEAIAQMIAAHAPSDDPELRTRMSECTLQVHQHMQTWLTDHFALLLLARNLKNRLEYVKEKASLCDTMIVIQLMSC
jgi:hypothetical protein